MALILQSPIHKCPLLAVLVGLVQPLTTQTLLALLGQVGLLVVLVAEAVGPHITELLEMALLEVHFLVVVVVVVKILAATQALEIQTLSLLVALEEQAEMRLLATIQLAVLETQAEVQSIPTTQQILLTFSELLALAEH
jgi:hypothetical protein